MNIIQFDGAGIHNQNISGVVIPTRIEGIYSKAENAFVIQNIFFFIV